MTHLLRCLALFILLPFALPLLRADAMPSRSGSATRSRKIPKPHLQKQRVPKQSSKYPSSRPRTRHKTDPQNRRTA